LQLLLITKAGRGLRLPLRPRQRGQEHRRQDCDDGDDHQEFYQRESAATPEKLSPSFELLAERSFAELVSHSGLLDSYCDNTASKLLKEP
jgi:hypothetical protein